MTHLTPYQRLDHRIKKLESDNRFLGRMVLIAFILILIIVILAVSH